MTPWYHLNESATISSPALLVYPDRVQQNILEMLRVAGSADRLRPHVKTHKCREIVSMQMEAGINKFKCATIAEAEMLADCGVLDILLAYQPVGPTATRYLQLQQKYPRVAFSALTDNQETAKSLSHYWESHGSKLGIFIDLDVGMHRTGIQPGDGVTPLVEIIEACKGLIHKGVHIYDGHIRDADINERKASVEASFSQAAPYLKPDDSYEIVAGGTPTFPVHAMNPRVTLSPGTCLLWDHGYSSILPDQEFHIAAVLLTRVISKPGEGLLCLDLGHKALASEMPHPRVYLPDLGEVEFQTHSEEHLVVKSSRAGQYKVGDVIYGFPKHICPTAALHQEMVVIADRKEVDRWKVYARDRRISI